MCTVVKGQAIKPLNIAINMVIKEWLLSSCECIRTLTWEEHSWLITKCVRYLIQLVGVWTKKKNNHPTEIGNACLHSVVQVS